MSAAAPRGNSSVADALAEATAVLARAGLPEPRREARLLVAQALAVGIEQIVGYPERLLEAGEAAAVESLLQRRAAREPLSRIAGRREFWGLDFALSPDTLDPRPDSETLIETLLESLPDRGAALRILDLGTGSGCLLLALLSELPAAWGLGVDLAPGAIATAARNASSLGLAARTSFAVGHWSDMLAGGWDVLVCNPPYIAAPEAESLSPEVARYDPPVALFAGEDGLDAYREILPALPRLLGPGGLAAFEVGAGQGHSVSVLARGAGVGVRARGRDLAGIERCLLLEIQG